MTVNWGLGSRRLVAYEGPHPLCLLGLSLSRGGKTCRMPAVKEYCSIHGYILYGFRRPQNQVALATTMTRNTGILLFLCSTDIATALPVGQPYKLGPNDRVNGQSSA